MPSSVEHVRSLCYTLIQPNLVLLVERPAEKWPSVFAKVPLFEEFPYLLPCAMAASVTLFGERTIFFTAFSF